MSTYYIDRDRLGQFRYLLVAANGEPVLRDSEGHSTKGACLVSIGSVKVNSALSSRYEKRGNFGQHSFILKGANGETIGVSETYTTEWNRDRAIETVQRIAPTAAVIDRSMVA